MNQIDEYLKEMLEKGGSDLHISVKAPPRVRISGSLEILRQYCLEADQVEQIMREITNQSNWDRFLKNKDLDQAYEIPGVARFRTNFFFNHWGIAAVFRQIPTNIESLDELELPLVLKKIARLNEGLVLVTGPTGSGKSTTLAAIIDFINTHQSKKIITIEDPIEFVHPQKKSLILHREILEHSHSFSNALKSAFRSDPDIILIGEMRNQETMKLALTCAAMGILVFATLHTNNAPKTIDRIVDAFDAEEQNQIRIMLADSLQAVVSQLLCKKKGGGRIAVHEILLAHEALPQTIRSGSLSNIVNIINGNREAGMIAMDSNLQELLDQDLISPEEAYMKASEKALFASLLHETYN